MGVRVSVSHHVRPVTHRLSEVTVDQMDPDTDDLFKWSIIRPPTPTARDKRIRRQGVHGDHGGTSE